MLLLTRQAVRVAWRAEATRDPSLGPQMVRELEGHKGAATAVSFLPDGGPVVSGGADGTVRVWNSCQLKSALHNRKGFVYRGHTDAVTAVDCSPDGTLVASASKDRKVRLWHPGVDGKANAGGGVIKGHSGSVRSVNFSDDGAALLTASDDKTIKIWSLPEMRFMHALSGHTHWVRSAAFDPGHAMVVVSGGDDKTVRIWHMPRKNPVQTLFGHTGAVNAVAFHPDGFSIASASVRTSFRLRAWPRAKHRFSARRRLAPRSTSEQLYVAAGQHTDACIYLRLWRVQADCSVKLWDVRTGKTIRHCHPYLYSATFVAGRRSAEL